MLHCLLQNFFRDDVGSLRVRENFCKRLQENETGLSPYLNGQSLLVTFGAEQHKRLSVVLAYV
jgi:hypothetical protein